MALPLARLPRFLVLDPVSTVRIEMELEAPSCEIDVELQNPRPGRSFVLLIGQRGGPYLQRMRLSGRARILFKPKSAGEYLLMLANPNREPLILRLRGHNIRHPRRSRRRQRSPATAAPRGKSSTRSGPPKGSRSARRAARPEARPGA